jgi:hypothetical protein
MCTSRSKDNSQSDIIHKPSYATSRPSIVSEPSHANTRPSIVSSSALKAVKLRTFAPTTTQGPRYEIQTAYKDIISYTGLMIPYHLVHIDPRKRHEQ